MTTKVTAQLRRATYVEPDDATGDGWWDDETVEQREYQTRAAAVRWLRQRITALAASDTDEWYTGVATEWTFDAQFQDWLPCADLDQLNRDELETARWYSH